MSRYPPGERGWIKVNNKNYWQRDEEREAVAIACALRSPHAKNLGDGTFAELTAICTP
jgi:hypothetical protein